MKLSQKEKFPLVEAYSFAESHDLAAEIARFRRMRMKFKSYSSTVRRGYVIELFEREGLLHDFFNQVWPRGARRMESKKSKSVVKSCAISRHSALAVDHMPPILARTGRVRGGWVLRSITQLAVLPCPHVQSLTRQDSSQGDQRAWSRTRVDFLVLSSFPIYESRADVSVVALSGQGDTDGAVDKCATGLASAGSK